MAVIRQLKCIFADILYLVCSKSVKSSIREDIKHYIKWNDRLKKMRSNILRLNILLISKAEFRSVFYFRTKRHKILTALSKIFLPNAKEVEINGDIEPGLLVSHFHSVICPEKAGHNLRVGPGAVICGDDGAPSLGDNVYVASNSVVMGDIHIGDNVIIGAGSVVTNDLESNAVYVGNPAHFVKEIKGNDALMNEIT